MNNCTFIGRLVNDPDIATTNSGTTVTKFKIAIERAFKNADGQKQSDFIPCIAWKKTGEIIHQYFTKGSKIAVIGSMQSGSYTAKDGTKRYTLDLIVEKFFFVERATARSEGDAPPQIAPDNGYAAPAPMPVDDPGPCPFPAGDDVPLPFDI